MKKPIRNLLLLLLLLLVLYLLLWPVNLRFQAWEPPEAPPLEGPYASNQALAALEKLPCLHGEGPEDVCRDSLGHIYTGLMNGQVIRYSLGSGEPELYANTGGRPLGLLFDKQGNLIIADADKGLLSVTPEREVKVLASGHEGEPFRFADDLDIAEDGKVYFSDASRGHSVHDWKDDILAHSQSGRLLVYDPATGTTEVLLDGLAFANGVAVGPDDAYLLINETAAYRIIKYWLKGPKAGQSEVFIENLPGFPDNISYDDEGTFWVALPNPRNPMLDKLLPSVFLRKVVKRLPEALQPKPVRYGFALGLNEQAEVIHNLQDPSGSFAPITSVKAYGDYLYFGSLSEPEMGRMRKGEK
jgi:sugar lactone lactonase YvrE